MLQKTWQWILGMLYVIAVAVIWIVASFVVQSVVDSGVSPFLITYICNTLFIVYIPIVELGRWTGPLFTRLISKDSITEGSPAKNSEVTGPETENLLEGGVVKDQQAEPMSECSDGQEQHIDSVPTGDKGSVTGNANTGYEILRVTEEASAPVARMWTRRETACTSLLVCPFWFLAQYTFNLSLKYTTVTSNTILSSTSSLFTYLMSLMFLQEKFTWIKLISVLLCMVGTVIVSFSDSEEGTSIATSPAWGDALCVVSALFFAVYTILIRKRLPDESRGKEKASTALFLGFLGLFNGLILLPIALVLHFTGVEPFHRLTLLQYGLIIGKGLLDNVLSDYLWAKAVLLTSTTAATAGLTIQVPIAAFVDFIRGIKVGVLDYVGGAAVLVGFVGINQTVTGCCSGVEAIDNDPDAGLEPLGSK